MAGTSLLSVTDVAEINQIKADAWETRLATSGQLCTILQPVGAVNPITGATVSYIGSAIVSCVVADVRTQPEDRVIGDVLRGKTAKEVWLPTGTEIDGSYHIEDQAGTEYEIVGAVTGPSSPNAPSFPVSVVVVR